MTGVRTELDEKVEEGHQWELTVKLKDGKELTRGYSWA